MAPEIMKDDGYNCLADYYNIGTLAYELVTGRVPVFDSDTRTFIGHDYLDHLSLSEQLKDFIVQLLQIDPKKRLGAQKGLNEICEHPWLKDVKMLDVSKKKTTPPIIIDAYAVSFKNKRISYNIDENNDFYSEGFYGCVIPRGGDRTVTHFSFYGFGESTENLLSCYCSPASFTKMPTMNNISTAYSPYNSTAVENASGAVGTSRFNNRVEDFEADQSTSETIKPKLSETDGDTSEGDDKVAKKFAQYDQQDKKPKKIMQNFPKWLSTAKTTTRISTTTNNL